MLAKYGAAIAPYSVKTNITLKKEKNNALCFTLLFL